MQPEPEYMGKKERKKNIYNTDTKQKQKKIKNNTTSKYLMIGNLDVVFNFKTIRVLQEITVLIFV